MTKNPHLGDDERQRRPIASIALMTGSLIVAGAAGWPAPSSAQATIGAELRLAELEKAFWVCDHAAMIGPIDSGTAITCGSLTEALKQRKFDGDFNAMLAWWRQHKKAEHLALAQAGGTSLSRLAPTAPQNQALRMISPESNALPKLPL